MENFYVDSKISTSLRIKAANSIEIKLMLILK